MAKTIRPTSTIQAAASLIVPACFELLGRRWNAYLVWALLDGPRRFTELLAAAGGVSDRMLTKRLRELEAAGIVTRHRYREVPPRVEYALTERGQALRPVIEAMERWGRHTGDPGDAEGGGG